MTDASSKWGVELAHVAKYIDDPFILSIWTNYEFPNITYKGEPLKLDSNINVYEACFISVLIDIYIKTYSTATQPINIVEIGLAYGTSTITALNKVMNFQRAVHYDIIDKYQSVQWHDLGMKNISNFVAHKSESNVLSFVKPNSGTTKLNTDDRKHEFKSILDYVVEAPSNSGNMNGIDLTLHQEFSIDVAPRLHKAMPLMYDLAIIDGSHAEDIVLQDFMNVHKMLKVNALMFIDDVLHAGVKAALLRFYDPKVYRVVYSTSASDRLVPTKLLYDKKRTKRNFFNPNSMTCLQKISTSKPKIKPKVEPKN